MDNKLKLSGYIKFFKEIDNNLYVFTLVVSFFDKKLNKYRYSYVKCKTNLKLENDLLYDLEGYLYGNFFENSKITKMIFNVKKANLVDKTIKRKIPNEFSFYGYIKKIIKKDENNTKFIIKIPVINLLNGEKLYIHYKCNTKNKISLEENKFYNIKGFFFCIFWKTLNDKQKNQIRLFSTEIKKIEKKYKNI